MTAKRRPTAYQRAICQLLADGVPRTVFQIAKDLGAAGVSVWTGKSKSRISHAAVDIQRAMTRPGLTPAVWFQRDQACAGHWVLTEEGQRIGTWARECAEKGT